MTRSSRAALLRLDFGLELLVLDLLVALKRDATDDRILDNGFSFDEANPIPAPTITPITVPIPGRIVPAAPPTSAPEIVRFLSAQALVRSHGSAGFVSSFMLLPLVKERLNVSPSAASARDCSAFLWGRRRAERRPLLHELAPLLEHVAASVGLLYLTARSSRTRGVAIVQVCATPAQNPLLDWLKGSGRTFCVEMWMPNVAKL